MTLDPSFDVEIIEEVFNITIEDQHLLDVDLIVVDQIPGRPTTLSMLGDVKIINPTNNQGLVYIESEGKWKNQTLVAYPNPTRFIQGEIPSPLCPVLSTARYTTSNHFATGTLEIFLNGLKLLLSDITIHNDHQFSIHIDTLITDVVTVNYIKEF
jgi:hypothetical protein